MPINPTFETYYLQKKKEHIARLELNGASKEFIGQILESDQYDTAENFAALFCRYHFRKRVRWEKLAEITGLSVNEIAEICLNGFDSV